MVITEYVGSVAQFYPLQTLYYIFVNNEATIVS